MTNVTPENQIAIWQQKLGSTPDLTALFNTAKAEEIAKKTANPDGMALQRIYSKVKKLTNSKAVSFTGMVIAKADPVDYNAYKWAKAKKLFEKDPGVAISGEYDDNGKLLFKTNEKGEPLDVTEFWKSGDANKNFLKPIDKNSWTLYVDGVASLTKPDEKNPTKADVATRFSLTIKGDMADPNSPNFFNPPEGVAIEFRALDKTGKDDSILQLNGAVVTKWVPSTVQLPTAQIVVEKYYQDAFVPAHQIVETFEKKGKAFIIVDGFVVSMNRELNKKGSRMVQISTMEMEDLEKQKMITGWIPKHVSMDFGEESQIRLIGMTDRSPVYEEGKPTGEVGDVTINARAIQILNKVDAPQAAQSFDPSKFNGTPEAGSTIPSNFMA